MRIKNRLLLNAAAAVGLMGLATGLQAATLSESSNAPSSNLLAFQLSSIDVTQDSNGDYTDNSGPVGETFTVTKNAIVNAITVLGNSDDGLDATQNFHIEVGTVDPSSRQITQLHAETAPQVVASDHSYLTFNLDTGVSVAPGTEYEFSIYTDTAQPGVTGDWYGLAHSVAGTHPDNGGTGFNYDKSTVNHDDNSDGLGKNLGWISPGFVAPNIHDYEYVFAVQGTPIAVPEPLGAGLLAIAGLGLFRRRRA